MKSSRTRPRSSRRAEQMIAALLEHSTQEKAAAALGISTVTLWRWLQKPGVPESITAGEARCLRSKP
jgi:transcriptional regulator with PAS, ATPase and Fis domain